MAEWQLRLGGDPVELEHLRVELPEPSLAVRSDGRGFYVASAALGNDENVTPTKAEADATVTKLNGLIHFLHGRVGTIALSGLEFARDDGTRIAVGFIKPIVMRGAIVVGRGVALRDGVELPGPRSRSARLIEVAEKNPDAAHVLRILGTDLDWVSMYKVVEIVKKHVGGENGIAARGWASKKEVNLFTHTANSVGALGDRARHGVENTQPPGTPMTKREAVSLTQKLARAWLDSII